MRLIVGVTGASGVIMGECLLSALKEKCQTYLVATRDARVTWEIETGRHFDDLIAAADCYYDADEMTAPIASGSFMTDGMVIMPCSMKTLAGIVSGYAENLLQRAADVCLKEGRKVVLVPRETPLGRVHLRNLLEASSLGCAILPPMLTFYNAPQTLEDQIDHIVGKALMQFNLNYDGFRPWRPETGNPVKSMHEEDER